MIITAPETDDCQPQPCAHVTAPATPAAPELGNGIYQIRFNADESAIVVTGYDGEVFATLEDYDRATHGEFAGFVAAALIRYAGDLSGYSREDMRPDYESARQWLTTEEHRPACPACGAGCTECGKTR